MTGKVVLVTGVSRDLGRRFARLLAAERTVSRVIGVDLVPPPGDLGDVSFIRADLRTPVIGKIIAKEDVTTVVHMSVIATPGAGSSRTAMKELNVLGTMQLLAGCQKAPLVDTLVVKSTTTVYGASSRDPAMFTEDMDARREPTSGYARDAFEVESYVRGFSRRRPDVRVTMLRAANVLGPQVRSPIASYFRMPVIPTLLGHDPRLQFLHHDDLMAAMRHAVHTEVAGTFNVAGDGTLLLSQAIRRLGRPTLPLPPIAFSQMGKFVRQVRLSDFSREQRQFLTYGRGVDTTRMRTEFGFEPAYTTARTLTDFAASAPGPSTHALLDSLAGVTDG